MSESNRGPGFTVVTICFLLIIAGLTLALFFELGWQDGKAVGEYEANSDTYARDAQEQIEDCFTFPDDVAKSICIRDVVAATNEDERAESDLVAQETMALWAKLMVLVSLLGLSITSIGVYLVWGTLDQTKTATGAAQAAVAVTREIGDAQTRAYTSAVSACISWKQDLPEIFLRIGNSGQTPAKAVWFDSRVVRQVTNGASKTVVGVERKNCPYLTSGQKLDFPIYSVEMHKRKASIQTALLDCAVGQLRIRVIGTVYSRTIFNERCAAPFDFFADVSVGPKTQKMDPAPPKSDAFSIMKEEK